jgi:hypothetical protein
MSIPALMLGLRWGALFFATVLSAQDSLDTRPIAARVPIPIRQLTGREAADTTMLMDVSSVRHLLGGGVIVNDVEKRQLVVYDATLRHARVIADTSSNAANPYGLRTTSGALISYIGDSTLFVDLESQAFLVIDPRGSFARVMAPVRATDMFFIGSATAGASQFDQRGRLLYRSVRRNGTTASTQPVATSSRRVVIEPDSAPVMRMDFDKRSVDSIIFLRVTPRRSMLVQSASSMYTLNVIHPLPMSDEWTQLPDGTIAIVRAQDYHMDWLSPNGTVSSSPRMPFDWRRITKEDKKAMVDSVKRAEAERVAKLPPLPPSQFAIPRSQEVVDPSDLPDVFPPVRAGQVRADPEGRVWILPSTSRDAKEGGLLYDVVDRAGRIVERVQLPKDRVLVGFGPNGLLYLNWVRAPRKATLERATVAR